jgi:hypothetical protein
MTPGFKLDLPSAAPRRTAKSGPRSCETCRDRGYIPLGADPTDEWGTAEGLAEALDRGDCCLCTCARGRWWRDWFTELAVPLRDRDGRTVPTGFRMPRGGIPDVGTEGDEGYPLSN